MPEKRNPRPNSSYQQEPSGRRTRWVWCQARGVKIEVDRSSNWATDSIAAVENSSTLFVVFLGGCLIWVMWW